MVSVNDATDAVLMINEDSIKLESDGFVQGIQITLSHDSDFEIEDQREAWRSHHAWG